jgi:hypothetical protein
MASADIAPTLAKDFVDLKIDIDRMRGGNEVLKRYTSAGNRSIPWFVFLDPTGKAIITSDSPKRNVGFPSDEEEIAYFVKILDRAKQHLTSEDVDRLRKSLAPAEAARQSGH